MPPYSTGLWMPSRPALPSFLKTSWAGKMPSSSHWSTWGLMSLSMIARNVRRISACSWVNCTVSPHAQRSAPLQWRIFLGRMSATGVARSNECSSSIPQPRHRAHQLRDDLQHHLVRAAADRAEAAVAVAARDGAVPQVAGAAPVLQAGVGDLAAQAAGLELGHRRQHGDVLAREIVLAGAVDPVSYTHLRAHE